ncbi:unnamed protein product [Effrenium voratum]|nr:unnamed protein product [Effrenium voratum]
MYPSSSSISEVRSFGSKSSLVHGRCAFAKLRDSKDVDSCVESPQFKTYLSATEDGFPWCFHRLEYDAHVEFIANLGSTPPKLLHWPGILKPWCMKKKERSVFDEMWWAAAKTSWDTEHNGSRAMPKRFKCKGFHIFSKKKWQSILRRRNESSQTWARLSQS